MKLSLKNIEGKNVGEIAVPKIILDNSNNRSAVRQAVLAELANLRQGTHSSKNRSAVRGGGKKPWKQKGRGAARAGTIRSPLWRGGGVVFGPSPHKYRHKVSKKLSVLARRSVFMDKLKNEKVLVFDNFLLENGKTSFFHNLLASLGLSKKKITLLVFDNNDNLHRAASNLSFVYIVDVNCVSIYELLDCEYLLMDENSFNCLIQILAK
tara:strand:+ start:2134 stop:2760 length:627 start_codon:yes stop_codon:yes gene_type:complete